MEGEEKVGELKEVFEGLEREFDRLNIELSYKKQEAERLKVRNN